MFIAIHTYKKTLSEVDRFLAAHREYLAKHYATGDFIASGPQTPRVGGVIMIKADDRTVVDAIIAKKRSTSTVSPIIRLWNLLRRCSAMMLSKISSDYALYINRERAVDRRTETTVD